MRICSANVDRITGFMFKDVHLSDRRLSECDRVVGEKFYIEGSTIGDTAFISQCGMFNQEDVNTSEISSFYIELRLGQTGIMQ